MISLRYSPGRIFQINAGSGQWSSQGSAATSTQGSSPTTTKYLKIISWGGAPNTFSIFSTVPLKTLGELHIVFSLKWSQFQNFFIKAQNTDLQHGRQNFPAEAQNTESPGRDVPQHFSVLRRCLSTRKVQYFLQALADENRPVLQWLWQCGPCLHKCCAFTHEINMYCFGLLMAFYYLVNSGLKSFFFIFNWCSSLPWICAMDVQ